MEMKPTRREFLGQSAAFAVMASGVLATPGLALDAEPLVLPPLPYAEDALAPYISGQTVSFHYGKHQKGYVDTTNKLIAGTALAGQPLEKIIAAATADASRAPLFNAAAQAWNHAFYWKSMRPQGGGGATGKVATKLDAAFGSFEGFEKSFSEAALSQFGSGWAWLVVNQGKVEIVKTANADTPLTRGLTPLLTIDVWEHAYYLDYQNRRADYVSAWLEHLVNWDCAAENLSRA